MKNMVLEMNQEEIRNWRVDVQRTINENHSTLKWIQHKCTHPDVTKEYKANTGNYDPSADRYWINFHCPDCDKRWMEDQ